MRLLGAVTNLQLLWFGEQHRDLDGPRDHVLSGETCRQGSVRPRKKQRFTDNFNGDWGRHACGTCGVAWPVAQRIDIDLLECGSYSWRASSSSTSRGLLGNSRVTLLHRLLGEQLEVGRCDAHLAQPRRQPELLR